MDGGLGADGWVLGAAEGVGVGGAGEGVGDCLGGGGEVGVDDGELEVGGMFAAEREGEGGVVADGGDDQVVGVGCGEGEAETVAGADLAGDGVELEAEVHWSAGGHGHEVGFGPAVPDGACVAQRRVGGAAVLEVEEALAEVGDAAVGRHLFEGGDDRATVGRGGEL